MFSRIFKSSPEQTEAQLRDASTTARIDAHNYEVARVAWMSASTDDPWIVRQPVQYLLNLRSVYANRSAESLEQKWCDVYRMDQADRRNASADHGATTMNGTVLDLDDEIPF